jgi:methanogenic corrinoid protein MtbC1
MALFSRAFDRPLDRRAGASVQAIRHGKTALEIFAYGSMLIVGEDTNMGRQAVGFDPEAFSRTASLFETKRRGFPPEAIETLADDIVRGLARMQVNQPRFDAASISEESLAAFCDALVMPDTRAALDFIEARRAEGVTRQDVYLGYIAAAARRLGEGWESDRLSFVDVAYGTGHLYALMRALRAERPSGSASMDARKQALFATVPGEDHGIGITLAADLFRDEGWEIDLKIDTDHDALLAHVEATRPHIVGLSLSTDRRLDALVRLVVGLRIRLPEAIIGVAPAGDLKGARIQRLVDIDLVFDDAPTACADLARLMALRG